MGKDYPSPIVDHAVVSKRNMNWMSAAYARHKEKVAANKKTAANKKKRKKEMDKGRKQSAKKRKKQ